MEKHGRQQQMVLQVSQCSQQLVEKGGVSKREWLKDDNDEIRTAANRLVADIALGAVVAPIGSSQ